MNVLVLVDGEHYPSVTRWGIEVVRSMGHEVLAALFLGGTEKILPGALPDLGVLTLPPGEDAPTSLAAAIAQVRPEAVVDLSDEPVVGYRERMGLVGVTLAAGVPYLGADFRFDPPVSGPALPVPALAVIGTGKRTGKTAVAGQVARIADAAGLEPVVVAMGRGGPPRPQIAERGSVTVERLLELEAQGHHAASDYLEDALMAGVTTVGARRVGGGLAGAAFASNAAEAARVAVEAGAGIVILEGSGSVVPPVPWDAGILVVPASAPPEYLGGYLGPYRLLRSDLVIITMGAGPGIRADNLSALRSHAMRWNAAARIIVTDLEPVPLKDVQGKTAFFATTAPADAAERHVPRLEAGSGCTVVGLSSNLADRARLVRDLEAAPPFEVLLTELKAAAVDVACHQAIARGAEVVFVDNRAVVVDADDDLDAAMTDVIDAALARTEMR
jgi:cyclic 2,3-diphosphoglycerate synthetase